MSDVPQYLGIERIEWFQCPLCSGYVALQYNIVRNSGRRYACPYCTSCGSLTRILESVEQPSESSCDRRG